ncbi:pseudouridine synthase [Ruminococcus sp. CAG:382]|nr:pseudouridine synthase [Ruminococcus sp. CAG:382]
MAHIGHPVTGDSVYGRKTNPFGLTGQCLFARYIGFRHPVTGEFMEFSGELPDFFINTLQKLRRSK